MSVLSRLWPGASTCSPESSHTALIVGTTVVTTVTVLSLLRLALFPPRPRRLPNPLHTVLPRLSATAQQQLDYGADAFPGARDVATPYGSMRVYEWGPETGRKVLFLHGISTTCMTLGPLAHALVARGCRVLLFDLFGRGFSDGVGDVEHDARLYVAQALMALASSPLGWTGERAFSVVGFSMGGGVAVHFAAAFGHMVNSLVLLAPAGLIRAANFGAVSRFLFTSGVVPESVLAVLTRWRLRRPIANSVAKAKDSDGVSANGSAAAAVAKEDPVGAAMTEALDPVPGVKATPLETRVLSQTRWMSEHHEGFVPAFMSSIRFAPLSGQQESWRALARREPGTTVLIFGRDDTIVNPRDYEVDALPLVGGKDNVVWREVTGSHDFPMTHTDEVLDIIIELWGL